VKSISLFLFGAALLWTVSLATAQSASDFYAGKQITLIVGASTGGGYDTQARLVARHLGKHIPGNPIIIVQNMPGAGSLAATNYIYNVALNDGSVIALVQRTMLLIKNWKPQSIRFDVVRLNWIGSINSEVAVVAAWYTAPHKSSKDLFEKELIVGGVTGADPETTPRLFNAVLGTRFRIIKATQAPPRSLWPWRKVSSKESEIGRGPASRPRDPTGFATTGLHCLCRLP